MCSARPAYCSGKRCPSACYAKSIPKPCLATVNDVRSYYGIFNKKGKAPVLLLHGAFVSSDVCGFEVPLLMKTHEVIAVDSRGHGRSSMPDQAFSYDLMAADVLQLMDVLRIKKASIVGWSEGGIHRNAPGDPAPGKD